MTSGFNCERHLAVLVKAEVLETNVIPFLWGLQTILEAEARRLIQCLLYGLHLSIAQVM